MSEQPQLPEIDPDEKSRRALLEAIIYAAEEPLTAAQIAKGIDAPKEQVEADLEALAKQWAADERGIEIRKVAQGYKMSTKAEHHDGVRKFVKTLRPKLKLSLPALETLAVIAYKQPVTVPEIQAVRGVNSTGVISTLLNRKLISTAGRKAVIGRPMQYKTTKDFLIQFGLDDLTELPTLKELEDLGRAALGEIDEIEESDEETNEASAPAEEDEAPESAEDEAPESEGAQSDEPEGEPDSDESEESNEEADSEEPGEPGEPESDDAEAEPEEGEEESEEPSKPEDDDAESAEAEAEPEDNGAEPEETAAEPDEPSNDEEKQPAPEPQ